MTAIGPFYFLLCLLYEKVTSTRGMYLQKWSWLKKNDYLPLLLRMSSHIGMLHNVIVRCGILFSIFSDPKHHFSILNQLDLDACRRGTIVLVLTPDRQSTVWLKSQTGCPILYCKRPVWRVGVWPKWVGPAHSTLGQLTRYTPRLKYSKMSDFH